MFEHALDYIHQQVERLNRTSLERNQQPLGSLLSPEALDHLEDLSGCKARVKMPRCQMRFVSWVFLVIVAMVGIHLFRNRHNETSSQLSLQVSADVIPVS